MSNCLSVYLSVKSHAKVNLYLKALHIQPPQAGSYHQLASIFQAITLADVLHVAKSSTEHLSLEVKFDANLTKKNFFQLFRFNNSTQKHLKEMCANNVVHLVFEYFQKHYDIGGVCMVIEKNIPLGAGLGGGSSNAAATVWLLNKLFNLKLSDNTLFRIATLFGSDTLFFMKSALHNKGIAKVEGRGDKVSTGDKKFPYQKFPYPMVLVYPSCHVDTATAYAQHIAYCRNKSEMSVNLDALLQQFTGKATSLSDIEALMYNAFTEKILASYDSIHCAYCRLKKHTSCVALSGSGATVFGVFEKLSDAKQALAILSKSYRFIYLVESTNRAIELLS